MPVPVSVRAVGRAAVPTRHIVYNLVTTTHTFSINATTFADWEEVADPDPPQTEADRLAELNHQDGALPSQPWNPRASSSSPAEKTKPVGAIPRTATMEGGFAASTMVSRGGGVPPARIDSLEPGDAIEGGVVMAVIRLPPAAKVWLCGGAGQFPTTVSGYAILYVHSGVRSRPLPVQCDLPFASPSMRLAVHPRYDPIFLRIVFVACADRCSLPDGVPVRRR